VRKPYHRPAMFSEFTPEPRTTWQWTCPRIDCPSGMRCARVHEFPNTTRAESCALAYPWPLWEDDGKCPRFLEFDWCEWVGRAW